jgi:hypothetical protein
MREREGKKKVGQRETGSTLVNATKLELKLKYEREREREMLPGVEWWFNHHRVTHRR